MEDGAVDDGEFHEAAWIMIDLANRATFIIVVAVVLVVLSMR